MTERKWIRAAEAAFLTGTAILLACLFDYQYAMNDDVFIQAILSGKYSGAPDVHNIQGILPLNGVFVLLYRFCGFVPWFGVFVTAAQFGSLYGIVVCLEKSLEVNSQILKSVPAEGGHGGVKMKSGAAWRYAFLVAANFLMTGLMLRELVTVQYTYVAALLMTLATLRLYCGEEENLAPQRRFRRYLTILLQFLLAFCLRTEIFLFLLPFSAVLTLIAYHKRNGFRAAGREIRRWCLFWGTLLICILSLYGADHIGYADRDWADYRKLFDCRTRLYDFLTLPDYESNRAFYEEAGISEGQYELLENYNYSLDEEITSETLKRAADYADEKRMEGYQGLKRLYLRFFTLPLREGIWSYSHRILFDPKVSGDDYPWNFVCAALYFLLLFLTGLSKRRWNLIYLFLLFSARSVLWMYIILKQRTPARVTHSLFVIEIACLLALVFEELSFLEKKGVIRAPRRFYAGMAALFLCGAGAVAVNGWVRFPDVYRETAELNQEWQELLEYCGQRKDSFYFMDVYSTVDYSEKIFDRVQEGPANYDICGGWLAKSPLCKEKYESFGFSEPREALIEKDNVFFVAKEDSELDWLIRLYAQKGIRVELEYLEKAAEKFNIIRLCVSESSAAGSPGD